jgi:predicted ArsR family transcriptional regulator
VCKTAGVDVPIAASDAVLAQATRARLFALLAELKRSAPTDELAQRVGLHPNGVRAHLERLHAAGLVTRTRERQAVGRPRDEWAIDPDARPGGEAPRGYAELVRWLARAIEPTTARLRRVEATGREAGRQLAPRGGSAPAADAMLATLAALGFQPRRESERPGRVGFCLDNCPYRAAVRENQAVVCTLHRGLTRGLLDVLDPTARLVEFVPRDPDTAGCLITLDVPDDAA